MGCSGSKKQNRGTDVNDPIELARKERSNMRKILYLYLTKHAYDNLLSGKYDVDDLVDYGMLKGITALDEKLIPQFGESLLVFEQEYRRIGPRDTALEAELKEKEMKAEVAQERLKNFVQNEKNQRKLSKTGRKQSTIKLNKTGRKQSTTKVSKTGTQAQRVGLGQRKQVYSRTLPTVRTNSFEDNPSSWQKPGVAKQRKEKSKLGTGQRKVVLIPGNPSHSRGDSTLGLSKDILSSGADSSASLTKKRPVSADRTSSLRKSMIPPAPPEEVLDTENGNPSFRTLSPTSPAWARRSTMSGPVTRRPNMVRTQSRHVRTASEVLHQDLEAYLLQVDPTAMVDRLHVYDTYARSFGIVELAEKLLDTYGVAFVPGCGEKVPKKVRVKQQQLLSETSSFVELPTSEQSDKHDQRVASDDSSEHVNTLTKMIRTFEQQVKDGEMAQKQLDGEPTIRIASANTVEYDSIGNGTI